AALRDPVDDDVLGLGRADDLLQHAGPFDARDLDPEVGAVGEARRHGLAGEEATEGRVRLHAAAPLSMSSAAGRPSSSGQARAAVRASRTPAGTGPAEANLVAAACRPWRSATTTAMTRRRTGSPAASGCRNRSTRSSPPTIRQAPNAPTRSSRSATRAWSSL